MIIDASMMFCVSLILLMDFGLTSLSSVSLCFSTRHCLILILLMLFVGIMVDTRHTKKAKVAS